MKETPGGKKYIEISSAGFIGAAGDTYGEEKMQIFIDRLDREIQQLNQQR